MFELNGRFGNCKIFTDNVDQETLSQLSMLLNQPFVQNSQIRIMPDTHAGKGCVIGTSMTVQKEICPNLVGVDIGCGVLAVKIEETDADLKKLDSVIHEKVPSGFAIHSKAINKSNIAELIAPADVEKGYRSLGTLGGGNHFIECDKDESGNIWLVIHTGSRYLGLEVCKHYQNIAFRKITKRADIINDAVQKLKSEGKFDEIEKTIKDIKSREVSIPKDLAYVTGSDFDDYIHDMKITQEHAYINRNTIADVICSAMKWHIVEQVHTVHNYIDTDSMILRKGAVSSQKGERLIIPINMRDGSLICTGKGNPDWNFSAPHGAGRIISRSQAKSNFSLEEYQREMSGIYSTSVNYSTIDESPMAYKPMDEIIANIEPTVEINEVIKPIYNFKASGD